MRNKYSFINVCINFQRTVQKVLSNHDIRVAHKRNKGIKKKLFQITTYTRSDKTQYKPKRFAQKNEGSRVNKHEPSSIRSQSW